MVSSLLLMYLSFIATLCFVRSESYRMLQHLPHGASPSYFMFGGILFTPLTYGSLSPFTYWSGMLEVIFKSWVVMSSFSLF